MQLWDLLNKLLRVKEMNKKNFYDAMYSIAQLVKCLGQTNSQRFIGSSLPNDCEINMQLCERIESNFPFGRFQPAYSY